MRVHLCGVRGSIPAPGPDFVRYGGNTSCVAIARDGADPAQEGGTAEEYPTRRTFGHSTVDYAVGLERRWPELAPLGG